MPVPTHSKRTIVTALLSFGLVCTSAIPAFAQAAPAVQQPDRASAYYAFSMAHLYAEMAGAYGNRGEYVNKAIDFYKQAIKADPSASYIAEELSEFYVQTGQLEKALQEANDLLKANPENNDARKILARIYSRGIGDPDQGRIDQTALKNAIEQYQKITQQDPKDTESLAMLARLYRVSHDEAAAEKAYRQVLALDPDDEDSLNGLAMVYADRGDIPNAIAMLKQAIEKNPDPRMVVMLAEFYEQTKDFANAADTMKQALALTNDNRVRQALAVDLYAAGRFDEAVTAFQELATDDPRNAKLQLQIAEILERKHDFTGAAAALAKAKAIENSSQVRFAEAELMKLQGKTAQAIAAMQSLVNDTKKDQYTEPEKKAPHTVSKLPREHPGGRRQNAGGGGCFPPDRRRGPLAGAERGRDDCRDVQVREGLQTGPPGGRFGAEKISQRPGRGSGARVAAGRSGTYRHRDR
jgi:tetratricopeptide (TPR) repeat protein